jgi:hypothetical protein
MKTKEEIIASTIDESVDYVKRRLTDEGNYKIISVKEAFNIAEIYSEQVRPKWTNKKPKFNKECFFLAATKYKDNPWSVNLFQIVRIECDEGWYWGWCDGDGEEIDDLAELKAQFYMILPNPEGK